MRPMCISVHFAWSSRPESWNRTAVTASFDSVDTEGPEQNLRFFYILSHNTDRDFSIDSSSEMHFLGRLQQQGALTSRTEGV